MIIKHSLLPFRLFGWFIMILLASKWWAIYQGAMMKSGFVVATVISLFFCYLFLTWTWQYRLEERKIVTRFGPAFIKLSNIINNLESMELTTGMIERKNGPSSFRPVIEINCKFRPKPIYLDGTNKRDCSDVDKLILWALEANDVLGGLPINVSERFIGIYEQVKGRKFSLENYST